MSPIRNLLALICSAPLVACSGGIAQTPVQTTAQSSTLASNPIANGTAAPPTMPATPTAPQPTPMAADAFVSTMGVDMPTLISSTEENAVANAVSSAGLRHVRLAVLQSDPSYESLVSSFFSANPSVHAFGLTNCAPPLGSYPTAAIAPSDVEAFQAATGNHLDYIEGVNEPDNDGDSNWVNDTKECIAPFSGSISNVPFVAPSLITHLNGTSELSLGSVANVVSFANVHRYFSGRNPDTRGWGATDACGVYGALKWSICWAQLAAPGKPAVVTETGWNSDTEVDLATQAKYIERLFFVNAQAGITATSVYTLVSYSGGDGFGGDGLLNSDYSPKPAFTAIANLTKILSDPGPSFRPAPLSFTTSPAAASSGQGLRLMTLAKRDGSYDIAIWQETQSANPNSYGSDTIPAAVPMTLTFKVPCLAVQYAWQDDGSAPATNLGLQASFNVSITDRLTILAVTPV